MHMIGLFSRRMAMFMCALTSLWQSTHMHTCTQPYAKMGGKDWVSERVGQLVKL